jgi:monoamine oxidase
MSAYLAKDLDVRLGHVVSSIDYSATKANIVTDQGNFEADFVICCVPLGVLKKDKIAFSPALPTAKVEAIGRMKMGSINKFLLVWDDIFWDESIQYVAYTPDEKGRFNYFLNLKKYTPANALMTFAFGDFGADTETWTDAQCTDAIMAHLRAIYGAATPAPKALYRTKWGQDPFTYGSYSFATNGSRSTDYDLLADAVDDRLFFAGEHTHRDYRSTVHGAYHSGVRAAKEVAAQL